MAKRFVYKITFLRTGPTPTSPLPKDKVICSRPDATMTMRHRLVYKWTKDLANPRIFSLYDGEELPTKDNIIIVRSKVNSTSTQTYAIFSLGHKVEPPLLADNEVPFATAVSFLEICYQRRRPHVPVHTQQPPIHQVQHSFQNWALSNRFPYPTTFSAHGPPILPPLPQPQPVVQPLPIQHVQTVTHRQCRPRPRFRPTDVVRFFGLPPNETSPAMGGTIRKGTKRSREDDTFEDYPAAKRSRAATTLVGLAGAIGMVVFHKAIVG
ncbi:hypothetical protein NLJ89_g11266 [Agrocybe chaxingu]|uniref:Uncharacterized protein n=1 Tax=Agrocybe chaxingu TaxID=84603 RepID=A0A9W8JPJ8_9AGAR|nr:hypothetical protein NLJ89_g11266 [Agrocybe chaxingu]